MPGSQMTNSGKPYLRVVAGKIVQKVEEGTENAKFREYELSNGEKGSKWELVYLNWTGTIRGIKFKDTDFGEDCVIELDDAYLALGTASRYFQDFASKVFSGDIKKPLLFHPYDMETDGRRRSGISLQQDNEKLKNYFYDGEKNLHGFPEPDAVRKVKKSYWKIFFAEVAEFLIERVSELEFEEKAIQPAKPKDELLNEPLDKSLGASDEEIADLENDVPDDLPF